MKNIYLSKKEIAKLEPVCEHNSGLWGSCYAYKNAVLKVFNKMVSSDMKRRIEKQLLIQSPIVMYPRKKLYLRGVPCLTFKGYLTTKASGFNLSSLIHSVKLGEQDLMFDDVLRIYYDNFLPLLLRENTCFFDVSKDHVFIDDNIFIADTDFYEIRPKWISERQKNQNNLYAVNRSFYNFFYCINPVVHQVVKLDFQDEAYLDNFIADLNKKTAGRVKSLRMLYDYDKIK